MRNILIKDFKKMCHEHGIKATAQRYEIYSSLIARNDHPTADQLYDAIAPKLAGMTMDTVYRCLTVLTLSGMVNRVPLIGGAGRYDGQLEPHQHFVCEICGELIDFCWPDFDDLKPSEDTIPGVTRRLALLAIGACPACAAKQLKNTAQTNILGRIMDTDFEV